MPDENEEQLNAFLRELTELSCKHKLGITGTPTLFVMEHDDHERVYSCDAESSLIFR